MLDKTTILKEALHEFCHAINEGSDYEESLIFIANYFAISKQELENSYNEFVFSL